MALYGVIDQTKDWQVIWEAKEHEWKIENRNNRFGKQKPALFFNQKNDTKSAIKETYSQVGAKFPSIMYSEKEKTIEKLC